MRRYLSAICIEAPRYIVRHRNGLAYIAFDTLRNGGPSALARRTCEFIKSLVLRADPVLPTSSGSAHWVQIVLPLHRQVACETVKRTTWSVLSSIDETHLPFRIVLAIDGSIRPEMYLFLKQLERMFPHRIVLLDDVREVGLANVIRAALRNAQGHIIVLDPNVEIAPGSLLVPRGDERTDREPAAAQNMETVLTTLLRGRPAPGVSPATQPAKCCIAITRQGAALDSEGQKILRELREQAARFGFRYIELLLSSTVADVSPTNPEKRETDRPRVGFDASLLSVARGSGTESHLRNTLRELGQRDDLTLHVYGPASTRRYAPRTYRYATASTHVVLDPLEVDIIHRPVQCMAYEDVLVLLKARTAILTILDLILYKNASYFPLRRFWKRLQLVTRASCLIADRITVISEHVKRELVAHLGVRPDKIEVVYLGVEERFRKVSGSGSGSAVARTYHLSHPYILHTGADYPHKNQEALLLAYARLAQRETVREHLVLVGGETELGIRSKLIVKYGRESWFKRVHFIDYVAPEDLPSLYSHASLYVFPSLDEGFGLPPLEAMACECPVVASGVASIPEVAGSAALYIDPTNPEDIAEKIQLALSDEATRKRLVAAGLERVRRFQWAETARQLARVYTHMHSGSAPPIRTTEKLLGVDILASMKSQSPSVLASERQRLFSQYRPRALQGARS